MASSSACTLQLQGSVCSGRHRHCGRALSNVKSWCRSRHRLHGLQLFKHRPKQVVAAVKVEKNRDGSSTYRFAEEDEQAPDAAENSSAVPAASGSKQASSPGDSLPHTSAAVQQGGAGGSRASNAVATAPAAQQQRQQASVGTVALRTETSAEATTSLPQTVPQPKSNGRALPPQQNGTGSTGSQSSGSVSNIPVPKHYSSVAFGSVDEREEWRLRNSPAAAPALLQKMQLQGRRQAQLNVQNGAGPSRRPARRRGGAVDPEEVLAGLDAAGGEVMALLDAFSDLATAGRLQEALRVVEELTRAKRTDVLCRLKHTHFLRPAAQQGAVREAMRFVQLLPRRLADARTYNMLVSVCVRARDAQAALHALDMMKTVRLKPDTILYTNLISACAAASNANQAFKLYTEMRGEGLQPERQTYTALIHACAQEVRGGAAGERRLQLVLLERALQVYRDMTAAKVHPDAAVFNSLISVAGRANQLQRAFQALEDMQALGLRPNAHTFSSLIDACSRAGERELALRVYRRAMSANVVASLEVYASAIGACRTGRDADLDAAIQIYSDMQRNGVPPDSKLYGTLMAVAGAAGAQDLALSLQGEMEEEGIAPCSATMAALVNVCIVNGYLGKARELYASMRRQGLTPHLHTFNSLISAYGKAHHLGDAVRLVVDMTEAGLSPDEFTFAAVLNACQRADEAELAFDVFRLLKARGLRVEEAHCFVMLRICFNRIRKAWHAGGYPPGKPAPATLSGQRTPEGRVLLRALAGAERVVETRELVEAQWPSRAVSVYREALAAGLKPRLRLLERLFACLRVHYTPAPAPAPAADSVATPFKADSYRRVAAGAAAEVEPAAAQRARLRYDGRAVAILEEAITMSVLPGYRLTEAECCIDMRKMPPNVAEVYLLSVVGALQRQRDIRSGDKFESAIKFLVPAYDPAEVFFPSYVDGQPAPHNNGAAHRSNGNGAGAGAAVAASQNGAGLWGAAALDDTFQADSNTGLGVVAMLRRLQLWAEEDPGAGVLTLQPREITRWVRNAQREEVNARNTKMSVLQEQGWIGGSIANQQRQIRMGLNQQTRGPGVDWERVHHRSAQDGDDFDEP